jgi:hypothetical protein
MFAGNGEAAATPLEQPETIELIRLYFGIPDERDGERSGR